MWLVYVCVYICVCRCITCRWCLIRSLFSAPSHRSACGLLLLGWVLFKCHSDDLFLCVRTAGDFRPIAVPELYFGGVTGGATASILHVVSINYQETVNGEQSRASEHCSPVTGYPNSRAPNVHVTFCPLSVPFLFYFCFSLVYAVLVCASFSSIRTILTKIAHRSSNRNIYVRVLRGSFFYQRIAWDFPTTVEQFVGALRRVF